MSAAGGTPANVKLGPGRLWVAPLGTDEPVSATAALGNEWWAIGYTEAGTELTWNITSDDIIVAEEFDPIDVANTARNIQIAVEMAERTKKRLVLVHGGGAEGADDGTPFDLPSAESPTGVMMLWESDKDTVTATNRRRLFRNVKPTGTITEPQNRAPQKQTIRATFRALVGEDGSAAVRFYPNASGQV